MPSSPAAGAPLCAAPSLILDAEREESVMTGSSPTRSALDRDRLALFPSSQCEVVGGGSTCQTTWLGFGLGCAMLLATAMQGASQLMMFAVYAMSLK